jgi:hypothetical protein
VLFFISLYFTSTDCFSHTCVDSPTYILDDLVFECFSYFFLLLAVPEQWIVTVSHSVGYMTLILFVALAFVYKVTVVQEPVRGMLSGPTPTAFPANCFTLTLCGSAPVSLDLLSNLFLIVALTCCTNFRR